MNTSLYHYGVKGMKWGVRKRQEATIKVSRTKKLETMYEDKGFAKSDAKKLAQNRAKTEKALKVIGAVAVTAAVAYVAKKQIDYRMPSIITKGKELQRITRSDNIDLNRNLYITNKKYDSLLYTGRLASGFATPHKITMKVTDNIKVASRKKSEDAFVKLMTSDKDFRNQITDNLKWVYSNTSMSNKISDTLLKVTTGKGKLSDKEMRTHIYDAFNVSLALTSEGSRNAASKFYSELKSMGYDALVDINDKKYSGFNAVNPMILFNASATVKVDKIDKLMSTSINDAYKQHLTQRDKREAIEKVLKEAGMLSAYVGSVGVAAGGLKVANNAVIKKYRKEHPDSGLTDAQIIVLLNKQKK